MDHRVVEVDAAQEDVAAGGLHLEHLVADLDHRDVEGAAAEIVDAHPLVELLAQAVGQRGGGRLVDDAHHLEADHPAGVLHRLPLAVAEVGGDGHHRLVHRLLEVVRGHVPDLVEDARRDVLQRHVLPGDLDGDLLVVVRRLHAVLHDLLHRLHDVGGGAAPHQALAPVDGVPRVELPLALGLVADELVALVVDREDRRDRVLAALVGDELHVRLPVLVPIDPGGAAVGGAEVDTDDRF